MNCSNRKRKCHGFKFKNKLYALDSSLTDLSLKIFLWTHLSKGKTAMKLHVALDHDGYLPAISLVTHSASQTLKVAVACLLPRGPVWFSTRIAAKTHG